MAQPSSVHPIKFTNLTKFTGNAMLGAGGAMMLHPLFTQTMQIGIVLRDLDATMRKYVDDYGIGPWKISESGEFEGVRVAYLDTHRDLGVMLGIFQRHV